jgi:hypothetical protein
MRSNYSAITVAGSVTQEEIIVQVLQLLHMHLKGVLGHIGQEPYKGDFFELFRQAYCNRYFDRSSSPLLTGDAFREILVARWFDEDASLNEERTKLIDLLFTKWEEWRYAWDHHD